MALETITGANLAESLLSLSFVVIFVNYDNIVIIDHDVLRKMPPRCDVPQ